MRHPPLFTVADTQALRGEISGGHTKNLFLKDLKERFFLLTVEEGADIDLKKVQHGSGWRGGFRSANRQAVQTAWPPAWRSIPFGLINDTAGAVKMLFDAGLMRHSIINAHPLTNEATSSIARGDLLRFVEATGHEPLVLKLSS